MPGVLFGRVVQRAKKIKSNKPKRAKKEEQEGAKCEEREERSSA
jgi:hypothetical protein